MNRDSTQEGEREVSSDFEDSFLRELRLEPMPRLPVPGGWLGGPTGRRYHVLEWLGGGGMGQVFRAQDEMLQREVALKFLLVRTGFDEAALREARAIARLDHENIVRIFDVSEWSATRGEPPVPFLVMECLEGAPLSVVLKRERRLEVPRALEIMDGIAAGLAHAHERGIVHRDLKPGNVFLTRQGGVKLLDFGLSHLMAGSGTDSPHLPRAGTPGYMAPEQWRGEAQDSRTDLWAAGVVLYEMLTGELPFPDAMWMELRERVTSSEPMPSVRARQPEVPREVESLVVTLLAKDPARRLPTARELREVILELRARLAGPGAGSPRPVPQQRRLLVLLSCLLPDLSGLSERLGAEDVEELETAFQRECADVIQRHGGTVTQSMGGEVIACFGQLQVREDDAERAVRAALRLVRDMPELLRRRLPHLPLTGPGARVGLHTDWMALDARALQGEASRVVSRLASQAGPGEVLATGTTWTQVRGAFETEALGFRELPGLAGPVRMEVHRVLREWEGQVRFDRMLMAGGLTPLVGREGELRWLLELWERARNGRGAFVLLQGEAGIGKSRLLQELRERVPPERATRPRFQCGFRFGASALLPMAEVLQGLLPFSPEDSPERYRRELESRLEAMELPRESAQLLGLLLSLPLPEGAPASRLTPERRQELTYEALVELILHDARQRPVLLAIEDLHWADSSWLELLGLLLERIESARVLVVLTARPEFQPSWPSRPWLHPLTLVRLPAGLAESLVKQVARGAPLPEETVRALVERTDGIPLFIEEMTRRVLEGGAVASIPVTLNELLLARLDLLPSRQKALAQVGAVVGRDFSLALLSAVTGREDTGLRRDLANLVEAGLLQEKVDERGEPGYQFRHALFQEAAYQSLPRSERRLHHRRIARVLEVKVPGVVETRPELLAHHYSEGGEEALAVLFWRGAGMLATLRMAIPEAVAHLTRALEPPRGEPALRWAPAEEFQVLATLGFCQSLLWGFDSPEVARTHARAWALLRRMDKLPLSVPVASWSLFSYHEARAELSMCHELAGLLVRQGERQRRPELSVAGYWMMAIDCTYWGHARAALEYSERAMALTRPTSGPPRKETFLSETFVLASCTHSVSGRLARARELERESLALARRTGSPMLLVLTLTYEAMACQIRREAAEVSRWTEEILAISSERRQSFWPPWARCLQGWALAELGQGQRGLELLRQELARWQTQGVRGGRTYCLEMLAKVHLTLGRYREGLAVVREALVLMWTTGEHGFEVELRRVLGELLRASGREREARYELLRAIAVAREQGALIYELRATVSLCRLLRDTGRTEVSRRLLERILAPFEGEDSVDLQEARALFSLNADRATPPGAG
ncbi:protein kinase [Archangium violaceum]|uniref:protein kinase domain-containing protein n=1 Tax=Archangium violaceum TaxID=83451 RepID=UPI00194EC084|nr:protein kinase [Archangium violaceum]QRN93438.1 protein kinase [Archangium violaceum]